MVTLAIVEDEENVLVVEMNQEFQSPYPTNLQPAGNILLAKIFLC